MELSILCMFFGPFLMFEFLISTDYVEDESPQVGTAKAHFTSYVFPFFTSSGVCFTTPSLFFRSCRPIAKTWTHKCHWYNKLNTKWEPAISKGCFEGHMSAHDSSWVRLCVLSTFEVIFAHKSIYHLCPSNIPNEFWHSILWVKKNPYVSWTPIFQKTSKERLPKNGGFLLYLSPNCLNYTFFVGILQWMFFSLKNSLAIFSTERWP